MCLLFVKLSNEATDAQQFKLILVNVRDEVYGRPTAPVHHWPNSSIIGPMDKTHGRVGGTWIAMNRHGRVASLLNVLQPDKDLHPDRKGRGFLVVDYLNSPSDTDPLSYMEQHVRTTSGDHNQFRLVAIDLNASDRNENANHSNGDDGNALAASHKTNQRPPGAFYSSATDNAPSSIGWNEVHVFGNNTKESLYWPKLEYAKERFEKIVSPSRWSSLAERQELVESLFGLLTDGTHHVPDEQMIQQGGGKFDEHLPKLNSVFVRIPQLNYGSRTWTVILVDGTGEVTYMERTLNDEDLMMDTDGVEGNGHVESEKDTSESVELDPISGTNVFLSSGSVKYSNGKASLPIRWQQRKYVYKLEGNH